MRIFDEINRMKNTVLNHVMHFAFDKQMPERDITGKCLGECRDRVREGEEDRQRAIQSHPYNEPNPDSPDWTKNRNDQPGVYGGHI